MCTCEAGDYLPRKELWDRGVFGTACSRPGHASLSRWFPRLLARARRYRAEDESVLNRVVDALERLAEAAGGWTTARHAAYATTDIPIERAPALIPWMLQIQKQLLTPVIRRDFGLVGMLGLCSGFVRM